MEMVRVNKEEIWENRGGLFIIHYKPKDYFYLKKEFPGNGV